VTSVAFYISGHGFGHASRAVEIINAFAARHPDARILVRSSAARWLLERTIAVPFELDARPTDTGVVQIDSLHLDAAATIAAARDFHATLDARAEAEAQWLRAMDAGLVIADAPPLACAAAARADLPSVVISNFTWDWIYEAYAEHLASAPDLIPTIQAAYRQADAAWRLPLHGGFATFGADLVDVPFVARHSSRAPGETRERLGLPLDARLVLPSFGGYGVEGLDLARVELPAGWAIVRGMRQAEIYDMGLSYQDLVRAVDVVVTKPGYGIVSECIANGTALVYTSRGRFAEYDVFVREMPRYLRCAYLDNADLLAGRWRTAIESAINAAAPPELPRTDGAGVVASMMSAHVSTGIPAARPARRRRSARID
jgi:L-arabinokinase